MTASEVLKTGQVLGRYEIVRLLGQGGMGAVYEAWHLLLKKRFAVKTLLPSIAQIPEARARFLREAEAASRINHPNIVVVSDVGTEGDLPYMVMEFLEGQSLSDLITEQPRLDPRQAVDLLLPVMSAVAAGHDLGVVHRDLKPANIFLARDPLRGVTPKVLDFGVSKMTGGDGAQLTGTLAILGTAAYMSPEQARGARQVDGRSDQYAIGLVLYEMLTGVRAHFGESPLEIIHNVTNVPIVSPQKLRPELPADLVACLMRMLEKLPDDRYASLGAAGEALLPFASEAMRGPLAYRFHAGAADGGASEHHAPPRARTTAPPAAPSRFEPPASAESTRLLPSEKPETTLGTAAGQLGRRARDRDEAGDGRGESASTPRRRGGLVRGVIVLGAAGVAVAAFTVLRPKDEGPRPRAGEHEVTPPQPASAAPPAAHQDLPPAPAAAIPPAATVLPSPTAPAETPPPARPTAQKRSAEPAPAAGLLAPDNERVSAHRSRHGTHTSRSAVALPPSNPDSSPSKADCNPNFTLDANGEKHFKPECF